MTTTTRIGSFEESHRIVMQFAQIPCIDLGTCNAAHTKNIKDCVFVDCVRREDPPKGLILMDIRMAHEYFFGKVFETAFVLDVIEHLTKSDGLKFLKDIEKITKQILIFTPLGSLWETSDSDPAGHHSGWTPEEFEALGYTTWSWSQYHHFPDGNKHGAFWAWKSMVRDNPTVEEISRNSNVPI